MPDLLAGREDGRVSTSPLITAREAADILRCNERTVRRMVQRGDIPGIVVAGKVLVPRAELPDVLPPSRPDPPARKMRVDGTARKALQDLRRAS